MLYIINIYKGVKVMTHQIKWADLYIYTYTVYKEIYSLVPLFLKVYNNDE